MKTIFTILFSSIQVAIFLMLLYAGLIGYATFIENDYGTIVAKTLIYNTWFFNVLHLWLLICLIGMIVRYKLLQRKKYASLLLHLSFVIIIIGAGVTRFFGSEGSMNIREGESVSSYVSADNYINFSIQTSTNKYKISIPANISYLGGYPIRQKIEFGEQSLIFQSGEITKNTNEKNNNTSTMQATILYNDKSYPLIIIGGEGIGENSVVKLPDATLTLSWGAKVVELPFSITLDDFILTRYPGSMSPSEFKSKITLNDPRNNLVMPYDIYMNNTLDYDGYRFFQASYDRDEKGTILSVNNDPGKIPTYIGYFMLIISSIFIIFSKGSRFYKLGQYLKQNQICALALFIAFLLHMPLQANESKNEINKETKITNEKQIDSAHSQAHTPESSASEIADLLQALKTKSIAHAKKFGELQVQSFDGRITPLDSLSLSLLHKISKRNTLYGLNHNQVLLGMTLYPNEWRKIKMISISSPKLKKILGVNKNEDLIAFSDLIDENNEYKLTNYVEEANRKKPSLRDKFDKNVIEVDERANIALNIYGGEFLKIFPLNPLSSLNGELPKDMQEMLDNNPQMKETFEQMSSGKMWLSPIATMQFSRDDKVLNMLGNYFDSVRIALESNDWSKADSALQDIMDYQRNNTNLYIDNNKLKAEIFLNNVNIFQILVYSYLFVGLLMFMLVFIGIFKPCVSLTKAIKFLYFVVILLILSHAAGLMLRWYIGGHAPWSNAYESMLYVAFISSLIGVIFFSRSYLAISTSVFFAGMSLMVAHLGFMDPQIGNLVPVLKSYYLNVHVSVITSSYAFLGLSCLLGLITLILFITRGKSTKIDSIINSIVVINEMSMILGLLLLTIGNFLGGIWANESWGRYWGWDAKETWSLASIGVYAVIVHLRFVVRKNLQYIFSLCSVFGFGCIIMTYFGVNYFLDGLHSYAAGDPIDIPQSIYYIVFVIVVLSLLAFFKRDMDNLNLPKEA